jgi:hypothetical protein
LEEQKINKEGYLTDIISFYDDLSPEDYKEFASTQRINLVDFKGVDQIEVSYDFREVWRRVLFVRIAKKIFEASKGNVFSEFCLSTSKGTRSILDGMKKSLSVEFGVNAAIFNGKISFDPSKLDSKGDMPLKYFNEIAKKLWLDNCQQLRMYFFIDELVISNLNTKSDEYKARLYLIRDIVKVCCELNDIAVKNGMDFHFICSLRPEVRTKLNDIDPEISKIMDGNDVLLSWSEESLIDIFTNKIVNGCPMPISIEADEFLPDTITFGSVKSDFFDFLINNSWHKPRDMVRFLKVYSKINPNHERITEDGVKKSLNEYARISAVELFDQLSVKYSYDIVNGIRSAIKKSRYIDGSELSAVLAPFVGITHCDQLVYELYDVGVIGNLDKTERGRPRYFWSHRQEEEFDASMELIVHPGLMNYFNVRHR